MALPGVGGGVVRYRDGNKSIWDTLASVTSFKYLGRIILGLYEEWPVVVHNLWQSRQKWAHMSSVLSREGADARTSGRIYVAVVNVVLLYGLETWVTTPHIGRVLVGLHHRVASRV